MPLTRSLCVAGLSAACLAAAGMAMPMHADAAASPAASETRSVDLSAPQNLPVGGLPRVAYLNTSRQDGLIHLPGSRAPLRWASMSATPSRSGAPGAEQW